MKTAEEYLVGRIQDALAADPRITKQDVAVRIRGGVIHLTGQTSSEDRRSAITEVVAELCPGLRVSNELEILEVAAPGEAEVLG